MNYEEIKAIYDDVRKQTDFMPKVAIILGSGLGDFAETLDVCGTLSYKDIKGFPVSTVKGHSGRFVFGTLGGVPVVAMQGRVHYYEGYSMDEVVLPMRIMRMMGAEILILTNASGGMGDNLKPGDFMIMEDHISSFVPSPLIGANIEEFGTRFPDMSAVYDRELICLAEKKASELGIDIKKGVYVQATGPQYETPAEIRMFKMLGADAVGMSTVCEAIAAVHAGFRVCGISCVCNYAAGISKTPLTHEEIFEIANKSGADFKKLICAIIKAL